MKGKPRIPMPKGRRFPWFVGVFDRWLRGLTDGCNWVAGVVEVGVGLWGEKGQGFGSLNSTDHV